jgi:hypothetical protein
MELEVKHLAPYLPYGLELIVSTDWSEYETTLIIHSFSDDLKDGININEAISMGAKPILHPLSSINKPIEVNGKTVVVLDLIRDTNHSFYFSAGYICEKCSDYSLQHQGYGTYPYWLIEILAEHHIDFQGLIPAGLAIDINTLNNK